MSDPSHSPFFVSTDWLAERLGAPGLVIVDASWYLPAMNRDPKAEFLSGHIPGAVFFDLDAVSDPNTSLPHMLPDPVSFAASMSRLGLGDGAQIIVYDGAGLFSAPRIWWMLRAFGARDVAILDGGLPKWRNENRPLADGPSTRPPTTFNARLDHGFVANLDDVRRALATGSAQVVDARSTERFRGEAAEPRPGLPSGHMPGALNVPSATIVQDGRLKSTEELARIFAAAGVDPSKPVVTTCGSGVSAAILTLALAALGRPEPPVYDGSWTEWGGDPAMPVATGP